MGKREGSFLTRLIVGGLGLLIAVSIVDGIVFSGSTGQFLVLALIFGLINAFLRPILRLLSCPLILLTLGLFVLIINAVMLALTGWLSGQLGLGFTVNGYWAAFLGALVVSVVSWLLSILLHEENED